MTPFSAMSDDWLVTGEAHIVDGPDLEPKRVGDDALRLQVVEQPREPSPEVILGLERPTIDRNRAWRGCYVST
jgi:hypothetical protein